MNPANIDKLIEIFRVVLDLDTQYDVTSLRRVLNVTTLRRVAEPRWDSLAHTSLVAAIEGEFGLRLEIADMDRMTSFAATQLLLTEKGL